MAVRAHRFLAILVLFFPISVEAVMRAPEAEPLEITVLADEALRIPLTQIARAYARTHQITVTTWFSRTGEMMGRLRKGSEVDLVLTADAKVLKHLEYAGQIDVYATQEVVQAPLVLALPETEGKRGRGALDMLEWRYREEGALPLVVVTGAHRIETPMIVQALTRSELLARTPVRRISVETADEALEAMHTEGVAGLLLSVDVFSRPGLEVVQRFPAEVVPPAAFRSGVLAGRDMGAARYFLQYLRSVKAQEGWLASGLTPAVPKPEATVPEGRR